LLSALDHATRTVVARVRGELAAVTRETPSAVIAHCDPSRALCGVGLGGTPAAKKGEQDCVARASTWTSPKVAARYAPAGRAVLADGQRFVVIRSKSRII
jgi:hypothetical protein